ncbi:MAG: pyridoxamine 5'-phosphate oxidase family protein [Mucilaginibacter polytrichastri]|nr:pyridoxamine 5'-phosphate oxidase family protein [Mucilaginibacter polytrichastri]
MKNEQEAIKKLKELVGEVQTAMLCTRDGDHIHSRPMATAQIDDNGDLWFFNNEFSGKTDQIEAEPHVCLCYSHPGKNTYVCVMGEAEVINNRSKMEELWNPILKAWFPEGLDDPKISLLRVSPFEAEYWDASSSKMVNFFKMAAAAITGGKADVGEHGKLAL